MEQYWQYCTICTIYWNSSNIDNITIFYFILPAIWCTSLQTILGQYCTLYWFPYCCQYKLSIVQYCCQYWQFVKIKLFQYCLYCSQYCRYYCQYCNIVNIVWVSIYCNIVSYCQYCFILTGSSCAKMAPASTLAAAAAEILVSMACITNCSVQCYAMKSYSTLRYEIVRPYSFNHHHHHHHHHLPQRLQLQDHLQDHPALFPHLLLEICRQAMIGRASL